MPLSATIALIIFLGGVLAAWLLRQRSSTRVLRQRSSKRVVVLGQQVADARAVEQQRLTQNPGPSPLEDQSYAESDHGFSLLQVEECQLDRDIRMLVAGLSDAPDVRPEELRTRLSMNDLYTLMHFAKRSAVFALREKNSVRCTEALAALAMVDRTRVDPRDLQWAISVVDAVATMIGADRTQLYDDAAALASEATAKLLMLLHANRPMGTTLKDCLYALADDTPQGPGLVGRGLDPYEPSIDLLALAVRASEVIVAEAYPRRSFKVGSSIPPIWIGSKERRVENVLRRATGTVEISLSSRSRTIDDQLFNVYFSEMASVNDARWLAEVAPNEDPGRSATIAYSAGRVVCLGISKSTVIGLRSTESGQSLAQKLEPARAVLRKHIQG